MSTSEPILLGLTPPLPRSPEHVITRCLRAVYVCILCLSAFPASGVPALKLATGPDPPKPTAPTVEVLLSLHHYVALVEDFGFSVREEFRCSVG